MSTQCSNCNTFCKIETDLAIARRLPAIFAISRTRTIRRLYERTAVIHCRDCVLPVYRGKAAIRNRVSLVASSMAIVGGPDRLVILHNFMQRLHTSCDKASDGSPERAVRGRSMRTVIIDKSVPRLRSKDAHNDERTYIPISRPE